jgi:hypothetical protein
LLATIKILMTDIFQSLVLLATFNVALIAVAIANYAVSASYLGRETRLSRSRMERRKARLQSDLAELKSQNIEISEIKEKINKAEKDVSSLNSRIFFLSWQGAVIIPVFFFSLSFLFALIGMNSDATLNFQLMVLSSITLTIGFFEILLVIKFIDSAAKNLPIPEFSVYFNDEKQSIILEAGQETEISLKIENSGEEIGEDVEIYRIFPVGFSVDGPSGYSKMSYDSTATHPNCLCLSSNSAKLYPNIVHIGKLLIAAPAKKGTYDLDIEIYERKIGRVKKKLAMVVE